MRPMPNKQRGAALFIALIILLVVTLLALSGVRETTLEARITGNFIDQQKQLNYAEAALRQGETQFISPLKPLEQNDCTGSYCFKNSTPTYEPDFTSSLNYSISGDDEQTSAWYAIPAASGAAEGQAENPEYGNMMLGIGTFRYEVNAESKNTVTGQTVRLRSTTAKVFN